jgi:hypothetical protein
MMTSKATSQGAQPVASNALRSGYAVGNQHFGVTVSHAKKACQPETLLYAPLSDCTAMTYVDQAAKKGRKNALRRQIFNDKGVKYDV